MKKHYFAFLLSFFLISTSFAQFPNYIDSVFLDINNVNACIKSGESQFMSSSEEPQFEIPKGSGNHTVFVHSLLMGGVNQQGNLKFAGSRYSAYGFDYSPGPISDIYDANFDTIWNRVWKVSKAEIDAHIAWSNNALAYPNYQIPEDIMTWPGNGDTTNGQLFDIAPFVDINNNGIYEALAGDYPKIKGDMAVWTIFNDYRYLHTETGGNRIKLEVQLMAYAYNCQINSCINNSIYMEYTLTNRNDYHLYNATIGFFTDLDIHYALDDYIGCDVGRNAYYAYNGLDSDYHTGINPPAQAVVILKGSPIADDGIDNPKYDSNGQLLGGDAFNGRGFGDGIIDNEYSGLYAFRYFMNMNITNAAMNDPKGSIDYQKYLSGYWKDGTQMHWGGYGHIDEGGTGPVCKYMFPGDSDPLLIGTNGIAPTNPAWNKWIEDSVGNQMDDKRGLGVLKPFKFRAGSTHTFEIALVYAKDSIQHSVPALKAAIDTVRYYYTHNLHPCGGPPTSIPHIEKEEKDFIIYPNPARNEINIHLKNSEDCKYELINCIGKIVQEGYLFGNQINHIQLRNYSNGVYFIRVSNKNNSAVKKLMITK